MASALEAALLYNPSRKIKNNNNDNKTPFTLADLLGHHGYTVVHRPRDYVNRSPLVVSPGLLKRIAQDIYKVFTEHYAAAVPRVAHYHLMAGIYRHRNQRRISGRPMVCANAMRLDADAVTRTLNALSLRAHFSTVPAPWIVLPNHCKSTPWLCLGAPDAGQLALLGDKVHLVPLSFYAVTPCVAHVLRIHLDQQGRNPLRWPVHEIPLAPMDCKRARPVSVKLDPGDCLVLPRGSPVRFTPVVASRRNSRVVLKVTTGCVLGAGRQRSHPALWNAVLGHGAGSWASGDFQECNFDNLLPAVSPQLEGLVRHFSLPKKSVCGFYLSRLFRQPLGVKKMEQEQTKRNITDEHDAILARIEVCLKRYPRCIDLPRVTKTVDAKRKVFEQMPKNDPEFQAKCQAYKSALVTLDKLVKRAEDPDFGEFYTRVDNMYKAIAAQFKSTPALKENGTLQRDYERLTSVFMEHSNFAKTATHLEQTEARAKKLQESITTFLENPQQQKQKVKPTRRPKAAPLPTHGQFFAEGKAILTELQKLQDYNDKPDVVAVFQQLMAEKERDWREPLTNLAQLLAQDRSQAGNPHDPEQLKALREYGKRVHAVLATQETMEQPKQPKAAKKTRRAKSVKRKPMQCKGPCGKRRVLFPDSQYCERECYELELNSVVGTFGKRVAMFSSKEPADPAKLEQLRSQQESAKTAMMAIEELFSEFCTKTTRPKRKVEIVAEINTVIADTGKFMPSYEKELATISDGSEEGGSSEDKELSDKEFRASDDSSIEKLPLPSDEESYKETGDDDEGEEGISVHEKTPKRKRPAATAQPAGQLAAAPKRQVTTATTGNNSFEENTLHALARSSDHHRNHMLDLWRGGHRDHLAAEVVRVLNGDNMWGIETCLPKEEAFTLQDVCYTEKLHADVQARYLANTIHGVKVRVVRIDPAINGEK